ncbi:M1 family aminopeptidase [Seonamhaeicola maritimus]|uniref:M1 family metallopeptidase n=1 Tax=Seonamhaeicola maritimus TaxID=2591822 RepID=A0A5C7GIQ9_9FLAO|nr:M1 family aminopeptidase [Seonamhaeicola maritimus]TXG37474.1 M1 family metallopeptidase [Seonamhaeicola maritimus]
MLKTFFFSELKYTLKQPMVYIFLGIISLLVFFAIVSDNVRIGESVGNVYKNAPHVITIYISVMTIFGLLIATAFFNNAALRDFNNNFNEIIFSTPLSKFGYFFGKFFGALLLSTIPLLGVYIGVLVGSVMAPPFGWVDAERFGSFYLETFVNNYLIFVLPNMFFVGAIIYAIANKWRSTVISFAGTLIIIVAYIISGTLMSDVDNETLAALTDIFGNRTYAIHTQYYTPIEKNTLSPSFEGLILWNRLIWVLVGLAILLVSYLSFSFQEKNKKIKQEKKDSIKGSKVFTLPELHFEYNKKTNWLQFKSFFYVNFLSIVKSVTFKILFIFSAIILISNLVGGFEYFGLQSYPLTYKLIDLINNASGIFVVITLVFFSGELIWRDRDNKINEVIDATPHQSLISLSAKALSLVGVTTILHVFFVFCGVIYQFLKGYTRIELDVYFLDFVYSNLILYIVWSGVMIMIQVVMNNKYIGYFISIAIIFIWEIILAILDIQSNMVEIGAGPSLQYSDMNGFGPGLKSAMWFNLYWVLFAVICLLIAGALWNRGVISSLKDKILIAKKEVPKSYKILTLVFVVVWALVAGYVYYNTQILNTYRTSEEQEVLFSDFEKKYKKYEKVKHPKVTDAKYFIDIFPYKRDVLVKSKLRLTNENSTAIDSLHFVINERWEPKINIPNSELVLEDEEFGYLIYKLNQSLQPESSIEIEVNTQYITKGFENGRGSTRVVNNGTFLNNFEILPSLGYNSGSELSDKNTRKKYGLKPKDRMPELEENCSESCMANYLSDGRSDYINVETVISTSSDQIAVAPGSLQKQWEENGRNYYHYKSDHPSQNFYSFISAKYQIAKRNWNGIDIEVYYDEKHPMNVEMMLDAVERSLKYYTENFGPYYHKQCRIIEFPRYASFAQAFPGTMPYSEAIGFIINLEDEEDNNVVDAVIAHEMGHQWWAHQVVGANMQGGTLMSESFSEYSALMTMKGISKTPMKMREFLKYDHDRYLRGRSGEVDNELPLYKVENQGHIHYGKGSVILYALQDYIGEGKVNKAMRDFLNEYKYKKPPYPTSLDFLEHLEPQVPDSLDYLIKDWFKEITLYDNRMKEANYKKLDNGKYEVSMNIESYKIKADSIGNETKVAINDWIDIGVFSDADEENLLFEKRVKIDKPKMTFTVEVDSLPRKAAVDPRHLLIDRVYDDNIKSISSE